MSKLHILWWFPKILLVSLFVGCDLQVAKDFLSIGGPWEALQSPGKLAALLNLPYCQHPLYTAPLLNNIKPNQYFNSAMIIFRHLEVVAKLAKWKNKGRERKEGEVWENNGPYWRVNHPKKPLSRNMFVSYICIFAPPRCTIPPPNSLILPPQFWFHS